MNISYFKNKRILITGASGYIASAIIDILENIDCIILRQSRKKLEPKENKVAKFIDLKLNLNDINLIKSDLISVDVVIHLAAQTSIYFSENNPEEDKNSSVVPLKKILELLKAKKIPN
mgnify:CR=1 FL=1